MNQRYAANQYKIASEGGRMAARGKWRLSLGLARRKSVNRVRLGTKQH